MRFLKHSLITSTVVVAALSLVGCAGAGSSAGPVAADATAAPASAAASVTFVDGWAKAAESGMTGVFGTFENGGSEDVVVVAAETEAAGAAELHEMVGDGGTMTMRKVDGGFPLPAGDLLQLEPGGYHIMLLGLTAPLLAGDEVVLEISLDDGSTLEVTVPVKDFEGANEKYDGGGNGGH